MWSDTSHSRSLCGVQGRWHFCSFSSPERHSLTTAVTGMNAIDTCVLALLVFPRSNMKAKLLDGWMNPEKMSSAQVFQYFDPSVKPYENLLILTLNCHYSHTRNITLIYFAQENGVTIICFPVHWTQKLQFLDFFFMQRLITQYTQEIEIWLKKKIPVCPQQPSYFCRI